jgi:hypothetical protein
VAHASFFGTDGVTCGFNDLQTAINAAPVGGTVYVRDSGAVISGPGAVISKDLRLQGSDGTCSSAGTGTATFDVQGAGRALDIDNGAVVFINRMNLRFGSTTGSGGVVRVHDGATMSMFFSSLYGGSADVDGGCLSVAGTSVTMWDSVIEGCAAGGNGGAVALDTSYLFMDGDSYIMNAAAEGNGGLLAVERSDAVLYGVLDDGHADGDGGGIWATTVIASPSNVYLHGSVLGSDADGYGGGVYVTGGTSALNMTDDSLIEGNSATGGGGVFATFWADLSMSDDATIRDNHATGTGGGVFASGSDFDFSDSAVIELNTAGAEGGGVFAEGATMTVAGAGRDTLRITGNVASGDGGGLYLWWSTMEGSDLRISANEAAVGSGGGLVADLDTDVVLSNALINGNTASTAGGVLVYDSSVALDADFSTCTPNSLGLHRTCSELRNNVADGGGGIPGRGGAVGVQSGGSFDGRELIMRGNTATATGNDLAVADDGSNALLRNALVVAASGATGTSIDINAGTLDLRSSTFADQDTAIHVRVGATAVMHRNIVADNGVGAILDGPATGNCNLSQALAESPTGTTNDVGVPSFVTGSRSDYQLAAVNPLVIDVCNAGPTADVDGKPRPSGAAFDRGAYERN